MIKSEVKKRFDKATNVVAMEEELLPPAAQKEKGRAHKRKKKEKSPKDKTGSLIKGCKRVVVIDIPYS